MSRPLLALFATREAQPADVLELLRVVAAAVAAGLPVRLAETPQGAGVLTGDDPPDEVLRYVEVLGTLGVAVETLPSKAVPVAIARASSVLRLARPGRPGVPVLLDLAGPVLPERPFLDAGQVTR